MQANVILDNLIADGELDPLVVVMPHGFTNRIPNDDRPRTAGAYKPEMEEFAVDFVSDLVPLVESRYRVVADRAHRAIAGNSMGGGQALGLGLTHPEMFSSVASFSAAMQIANNPAWGGIDMDAALANAGAINELDLLWVGCGTEDSLFNVNKQFSAAADRGRHRAHVPQHARRAHAGRLEPLSARGCAAAVLQSKIPFHSRGFGVRHAARLGAAGQILDVLVVLAADELERFPTRSQMHDLGRAPRRRVRAGIVDRDIDAHVAVVRARETLGYAQLVGRRAAELVEPTLAVEPGGRHDGGCRHPSAPSSSPSTRASRLGRRCAHP